VQDSSVSRNLRLLFVLLFLLVLMASAQQRTGQVRVLVVPDHPDWTYSSGQQASFRISTLRDGHPLNNVKVAYSLGPEMVEPRVSETVPLPSEGLTVSGSMKEPGFLRCIVTVEVDGKTYRGLGTAGFDPGAIEPTAEEPADFDTFWKASKDRLSKLSLEAQRTLLPEYCTPGVDVYQVSMQNVSVDKDSSSRIYGILCEPKAEGKFPALLAVPGAGVRAYRGLVEMAEKGIITFQIGIHGLPVNLDPKVYDALGKGALDGYPTYNLDARDRFYYRRVYLGCVRANDYLVTLPRWNGKVLAVTGGSQGGALAIVTAALDPRVNALAAYYPALCDLTGYLHGRAGGWPHMFRASGEGSNRTKEKIETSKYYDVVNFARRLKVPGIYSWGFNDETCPPTSMYSAYNVISAPKKLVLALETGHGQVKEQVDILNAWMEYFLKTGQAPEEF
jgi:cephalosporin-C deacetylase